MDYISDIQGIMSSISASLHFKGKVNSEDIPCVVADYELGDVIMDEDGHTYVKCEHYFYRIDSYEDSIKDKSDHYKMKLVTHCQSCGAPLSIEKWNLDYGYARCEYCGVTSPTYTNDL